MNSEFSGTKREISIKGMLGRCGDRRVFMGFAPAYVLHSVSFADQLDEETGKGYQRPFNDRHSLDFRRYIQENGSTTIPLTFNLRQHDKNVWSLREAKDGSAVLKIRPDVGQVLAQVDCQHRLGYLANLDVPLAFMTFIGLSVKEEMQIFNIINSKAKGLSSSLLDFHDAKLSDNLGKERPELFIALELNNSKDSPWHQQLSCGGKRVSGMKRRASLRTMQKAVWRFLRATNIIQQKTPTETFDLVRDFWKAVTIVLDAAWQEPRKHFVTKGIGVYGLMGIASDLYLDASRKGHECTQAYFTAALSEFIDQFDWTNNGPLKGFGGESGADKALELLRRLRSKSKIRVIARGK